MTAGAWQRAKDIFNDALDLDVAARASFVDTACGDDDALAAEVHRLLGLHTASDEFLHPPTLAPPGAIESSGDRLIGTVIGRYQVVRRIATGGMGAVYEATQENPQRRVAIKVIRAGLATPGILRRFEREAQVLGRLEHPGIARIYEAGAHDLGDGALPYFAMEYVDGETVLRWATRHHASLQRRVELLIDICDAVEHAHRSGVVHRDLKPGNILVDTAGKPRILDFGVARAIETEPPDGFATAPGAATPAATMVTTAGELVGTLQYMSPEQIAGERGAVDERTDVHALGLLGYELIAGRAPWEVSASSLPAATRTILEHDPVPLGSVRRAWRGDLDTIFQKALEKSPQRRYQSAAALAADLRHHLADEPIAAMPPSALYQIGKFTRRHRALVGGVAATFIVLAAGVIVYAMEAAVARSEARRARYEADKMQVVNDFLVNDFMMSLLAAPPTDDPARTITERIDAAAASVPAQFADAPLHEAAVRLQIGTMYYNVGRFDEAVEEFRRSQMLRERHLAAPHADMLKSRNALAQALRSRGDRDAAEVLFRSVLADRERLLGPDDNATLRTANDLGMLLASGEEREAGHAMLASALKRAEASLGAHDKTTLVLLANVAMIARSDGDLEKAERLGRRSVEGFAASHGERHVATATARGALARTYRALKRHEDALKLQEHAAEDLVAALGATHPSSLVAVIGCARSLYELDRFPESATIFERAADDAAVPHGDAHTEAYARIWLGHARRKTGDHLRAAAAYEHAAQCYAAADGPASRGRTEALRRHADALVELGDLDQARRVSATAMEIATRSDGVDALAACEALYRHARVLGRCGAPEEAVPYLEQAIAGAITTAGADTRSLATYRANLGTLLIEMKQYRAAETVVLADLAHRERVFGASHARTHAALDRLIGLYTEWGRSEDVAAWELVQEERSTDD